ncbi:MAG: PEP-CTERM sorting domain-containing protein, partial [Candidatus Marinimicrobia bacterium]|nr:PEP-CTERM sorting domain-containing protein [Candidatus Neomarinimicrobiota bacterium]
QNETLSLLADGEVQLGADATLAVQGTLLLGAAADVTLGSGVLTISAGGAIGGGGVVNGGLTLATDAEFQIVDPLAPLSVNGGTISLGNLTVSKLTLDASALDVGETYTLIEGTGGATFDYGTVAFGVANAEDIGDGKRAFFQQGSLQLVVIPEPGVLGLLLMAAGLLAVRRRRR